MRKINALILLFFAIFILTNCAGSRGILDINVDESHNASHGIKVSLISINDKRNFEAEPRSPSTPSLKYPAEIQDRSITNRAIARKRDPFGLALGDILLPEGKTVQSLVKDALTRALREAGYQVVSRGDSGFKEATPIHVDINKFWAWLSPGVFAAHIEFETEVYLKGDIPNLYNGLNTRGYIRLGTIAGDTAAWKNTITKGLNDFIEKIKISLLK